MRAAPAAPARAAHGFGGCPPRQLQEALRETRTGRPRLHPALLGERLEKGGRLLGGGGTPPGGRVRHDAPELTDAREADPPSPRVTAGLLDRAARPAMLGHGGTMRVDEPVAVDRDHDCRRSHSCILTRLATSTPGGN